HGGLRPEGRQVQEATGRSQRCGRQAGPVLRVRPRPRGQLRSQGFVHRRSGCGGGGRIVKKSKSNVGANDHSPLRTKSRKSVSTTTAVKKVVGGVKGSSETYEDRQDHIPGMKMPEIETWAFMYPGSTTTLEV